MTAGTDGVEKVREEWAAAARGWARERDRLEAERDSALRDFEGDLRDAISQRDDLAADTAELLTLLPPWDTHGASVKDACVRLTLKLAGLPAGVRS